MPLEYDFKASPGYWICMTAHLLQNALNEELASYGITFRQWEVLAWLAHEEELSQTELTQRMRVEGSTLVGILDRMERDGWITRIACAGDRRKRMIRATEQVKPVWDRMVNCALQVRRRAFGSMPPEQVQQLIDSLKHVQENLAAVAAAKESA